MIDLNLKGKTYLITGASSGIGKAIAEYLTINEGANVVLIARNSAVINKMADELPGDNIAFEFDLEKIEDIEKIFIYCNKNRVRLDGMVYAAGIAPLFSIEENDIKAAETTMRINAMAFLECARCFQNEVYSNNKSSIVAISSILSEVVTYRQSAYAASKVALNTYVKFLAKEFIHKMRVNSVLLSVVNTPIYEKLAKQSCNFEKNTEKKQPLGVIETLEVSEFVAFLLSEKSKYITGSLMKMDSGFTLF